MLFHHEDTHLLHWPHLKLRVSKELRNFYAFLTIRSFALYSVTIFEPIYLYLFFDEILTPTLIYLAVRSLVFGILAPYGAKITSRLGIKHTILTSIPFTFLYFVGLWKIEFLGPWAFLLAVWGAVAAALYWPAYHIFFTRISDRGKRGSETSYQIMILSGAAAVAPLLGGFIIASFGGFPVLFALVLLLLFASMVPLFLSEEHKENYYESYLRSLKDVFSKKYRRKALAFASWGMETSLQMYIWPLFLFIIAISFEAMGAITAASLLIGIVFAYYIGKAADRAGSEKFLKIGVFLNAAAWPLKIFVTAPLDAFLANTLHRFARHARNIPFSAIFYGWAGESAKTRDKMVMIRETSLNIARGSFLLVLAGIFYFTSNIAMVFALGSILTFGFLFILNKK